MMTAVRVAVFSSRKPISFKNVESVLHRLAERHSLLRMKIQTRFLGETPVTGSYPWKR